MKIVRPKPEKWHNYEEGNVGRPVKAYFKKGFWKRYNRKKFFRKILKLLT